MTDHKYKTVSLFSGAMGLDIGLEQAGRFSVVAAVEQEHAFYETIRANHAAGRLPAEFRLFERDIKELDPGARRRAESGARAGLVSVERTGRARGPGPGHHRAVQRPSECM